MNHELIKNWISLVVLLILFVVLFDVHAASSMRCERKPNDVFYVILNPPVAKTTLWSVQFFKFNSAKSEYQPEKNITCKSDPHYSVEPQEIAVTRCQVIFGPDGGEDLAVISNRKNGTIHMAYVPWGPTGRGRREVLPCQNAN